MLENELGRLMTLSGHRRCNAPSMWTAYLDNLMFKGINIKLIMSHLNWHTRDWETYSEWVKFCVRYVGLKCKGESPFDQPINKTQEILASRPPWVRSLSQKDLKGGGTFYRCPIRNNTSSENIIERCDPLALERELLCDESVLVERLLKGRSFLEIFSVVRLDRDKLFFNCQRRIPKRREDAKYWLEFAMLGQESFLLDSKDLTPAKMYHMPGLISEIIKNIFGFEFDLWPLDFASRTRERPGDGQSTFSF